MIGLAGADRYGDIESDELLGLQGGVNAYVERTKFFEMVGMVQRRMRVDQWQGARFPSVREWAVYERVKVMQPDREWG